MHKNQPVDYNWKMLAAELQLPVPTIRIIQFNISTDEERHFETLKKWKQLKQSKATLNQLALVLKMFAFDVSEMLKINIGNEGMCIEVYTISIYYSKRVINNKYTERLSTVLSRAYVHQRYILKSMQK